MNGKKIMALAMVLAVAGAVTLIAAVPAQAQSTANQSIASKWPKAIAVPLNGQEEKPTAVQTNASGVVVFWYNSTLNQINYLLFAADLNNPTSAQVHWNNSANGTGPAVVQLFPTSGFVVQNGVKNGILAVGNFTASDLMGPLQGKNLTDLIGQMNNGSTYINVQTTAHPTGEIRGNIDVANQSSSAYIQSLKNMVTQNISGGAQPTNQSSGNQSSMPAPAPAPKAPGY